jgi:uncharacterized membrane protein (DUF106 family)
MSIRSKAAVETLKTLGVFAAVGVAFYFLLDFLGPKLGLLFMLVSMVGWFAWLTYSFYVDKFSMEEKFKL